MGEIRRAVVWWAESLGSASGSSCRARDGGLSELPVSGLSACPTSMLENRSFSSELEGGPGWSRPENDKMAMLVMPDSQWALKLRELW